MLTVVRKIDPNNPQRYNNEFYVDGKAVNIETISTVRFARKKPVLLQVYRIDMPVVVETLEGDRQAQNGCWLIEGVRGEMYPCEKEIFAETYEILEQPCKS